MLVYVQDALYGEYGEGAPRGKGPNQNILQSKGNGYLTEKYPNLSYVISAKRI
jgi:peptidyl-prolyl cis-trans isomerase A (cyclophilin A)